VIRIETPLPIALRSANSWLFPGSEPAILDVGLGTPEAYEVLLRGIRDAGVDPSRLRLLVSHGHADHAGNCARLGREFGCRLTALPQESAHLESFVSGAERRYQAYGEALRAHGVPQDTISRMRRGGEKFDAWTEDVRIVTPLRDGERVVLGDTEAQIHVAPGHTRGSMLVTNGNHLLSGDTLLEHITSNAIELADDDKGRYATYMGTLESLRRFVDCDVLPGHHDPFKLTDKLLDSHLEKHARRGERVRQALDAPRTAWELLPRVLPHMQKDQLFLGVCEMVGHLHKLELDGRVTCVETDGVRRFVAR
jgi:glyoxylase-like metal-dependent hydrolase (beta-lactamase superfamily II)